MLRIANSTPKQPKGPDMDLTLPRVPQGFNGTMHTSLQARIGRQPALVMNILHTLNGTYVQGTTGTTQSASGARAMPTQRQSGRAHTRTQNPRPEAQEAPGNQSIRTQQSRPPRNRRGRAGIQARPSAPRHPSPQAHTRVPAPSRPVITPRALENLRHRVSHQSVQDWDGDSQISPPRVHTPVTVDVNAVPGLEKADIDDWVISGDEWDNL